MAEFSIYSSSFWCPFDGGGRFVKADLEGVIGLLERRLVYRGIRMDKF